MHSSALAIFCMLAFTPTVFAQKPCPKGRALERQIAAAEIVVLGLAKESRTCRAYADSRRPHYDCTGVETVFQVRQVWKGDALPRHTLGLVAPPPSDPVGVKYLVGRQYVIFAAATKMLDTHWEGSTNACHLPDKPASRKALIKQLDAWKKLQGD